MRPAWLLGDIPVDTDNAVAGTVPIVRNGVLVFETPSAGSGDMTKAVYDSDDDGVVDAADTAASADAVAMAATNKVLGRVTAGAGASEEITCTAAGRAILDDADAATQRSTLGLGDSSTKNVGTAAGTVCAGNDSRLAVKLQGVVHLASAQVGANWYTGQGFNNTSYSDTTNGQSMWFSMDAGLLTTCLGADWTLVLRICLGATTDARTFSAQAENETDLVGGNPTDMGSVTQALVNTNPSYDQLPAYALTFGAGTLPSSGVKRVRVHWKTDGGTYIVGSGVNVEARAA